MSDTGRARRQEVTAARLDGFPLVRLTHSCDGVRPSPAGYSPGWPLRTRLLDTRGCTPMYRGPYGIVGLIAAIILILLLLEVLGVINVF